jgi:hypothetical protein
MHLPGEKAQLPRVRVQSPSSGRTIWRVRLVREDVRDSTPELLSTGSIKPSVGNPRRKWKRSGLATGFPALGQANRRLPSCCLLFFHSPSHHRSRPNPHSSPRVSAAAASHHTATVHTQDAEARRGGPAPRKARPDGFSRSRSHLVEDAFAPSSLLRPSSQARFPRPLKGSRSIPTCSHAAARRS